MLDTGSVGWAAGTRELRYDVDRLPLSDGRFHLRLGLADGEGELLHWLDDALGFLVYPAGEERGGVVRLEGSWTAEENSGESMSSRSCPDWPDLMEIAPDLQFMHYTVAEAQLPVDVLTTIDHVSLGDVAICCDLERARLLRRAHRSAGGRGAARDALVRAAGVRRPRPRRLSGVAVSGRLRGLGRAGAAEAAARLDLSSCGQQRQDPTHPRSSAKLAAERESGGILMWRGGRYFPSASGRLSSRWRRVSSLWVWTWRTWSQPRSGPRS